jgi:hypothetical protein
MRRSAVVKILRLSSAEPGKVSSFARCPHLRIEIWGTQISGWSDVGHPLTRRMV